MLAGVKALRFASTRHAAGFGLDTGSAQATFSNCHRLSRSATRVVAFFVVTRLKRDHDRGTKLITLVINI